MSKKRTLKPFPVRHTEASKAAADYLLSVLGARYTQSDIIREALIQMAEREKAKRND